ncbi:MAG: hypothetical protein HZC02_05095 [Candidatus Levybacteria bacterium]|nr:hypothetical protein [Candidatus Levybacteria bacterium]
MEGAQISVSANRKTTTKDGLILEVNEVIISADVASTYHPDGYSLLRRFTGLEYGNYQMRTLLSVACNIRGGIRLFPALNITEGQILRIRFRQNTFNDYDIMEVMNNTAYSNAA